MTDREWDRRLRIRTAGREDEAGGDCMPYEPTPYSVLERLRERGYVTREDHLLDYGCGKGRVAFFFAETAGCRVTGVDHSRKLIAMAEENRAAFAHAERTSFVCCRAERYEPRGENMFFFFNPFSEKIYSGIIKRLARYGARREMALTLFLYYPSDSFLEQLSQTEGVEQIDDIDCNDLFSRRSSRERLAVFTLDHREMRLSASTTP